MDWRSKLEMGIADLVIQIAARFDLETRQHGNNFAVGFDDLGSNIFSRAVLGEEFEKRGVAEVFLEIRAVVDIFGVNFRNRKAVATKVFGEFEEGGVFFADAVENADGMILFLLASLMILRPEAAEFALQRHNALGRRVEMLCSKSV